MVPADALLPRFHSVGSRQTLPQTHNLLSPGTAGTQQTSYLPRSQPSAKTGESLPPPSCFMSPSSAGALATARIPCANRRTIQALRSQSTTSSRTS